MKPKEKVKILTEIKGITLIALVVTIVVLIILAGISINLILGDNGIITNAQQAKLANEKAKIIELTNLAYGTVIVDNLGVNSNETIAALTVEQLRKEGYTIVNKTTTSEKISEINLKVNDEEVNELSVLVDESKTVIVDLGTSNGSSTRYFVEISEKYYELTIRENEISIAEDSTNIDEINENITDAIKFDAENDNVQVSLTSNIITVTGAKTGTSKVIVSNNSGDVTAELTVIITEPLPTDGSYSEVKKVNTPKIDETQGMKLVTFNTSTKTWVEDKTKSDYDYIAGTGTADNTSSRWANAIVTKDGIESLFVWIPRYAYKITYYTDATKTTVSSTNTKYGSIDVKFINGTGITASDGTVCKYANDSTLTSEDYIIHPAFTSNESLGGGFGELAGLWVGKFESSRSNADATNVGDSTTLKVVPSVKSWTKITIGEMYTYAKAYNTNLYSHMAKNSEWGAVAYLTHSKYGRNGNEIAVNQCSSKITGAGPGEGSSNIYNSTYAYDKNNFETKYSYTSEQGKKASTTGNEYGIYDFSGGAHEYVASYYNASTYTDSTTGLSRYEAYASSFASKGGTSNEYATAYSGETASSNYIKGDATYETSHWNSDNAYFVGSRYPFFSRSGIYLDENYAGAFYYFFFDGGAYADNSFRVVIVVK